MSGAALRFALAGAGILCFLGARVILADPAASEDSAWSDLPQRAEPALEDPLENRGRQVFHERCAACHAPIPREIYGPRFLPPMPGTQALQARYRGAVPAVLEERTDLTPEFVKAIVRGGLRSMPQFRPTELSDDDLAALGAYLERNRKAP